jgi:acetolactate synthase-1/2/3 large subunit
MADAFARVTGGLGVAVTSTGTAAGNAAGAMVEAQTAGTPVLHLTGQIELAHLDRGRAYIHEAPDQLAMLEAVSKAAFRVWSPDTALPVVKEAVRVALTAPAGPVSVEIPIDVQAAEIDWPDDLTPHPVTAPRPDPNALNRLADHLANAKRPILWLGGGARHAGAAVARLADMGIAIVTSAQGRGILPEDHEMSLGAFTAHGGIERFYRSCDAMVVVGSHLRGNETLTFKLKLPHPLYQIDADARAENRSYPVDDFVHGDSALALDGLADRLAGRLEVDPVFGGDIAVARAGAESAVRHSIGPYAALVDALQAAAGRDFLWVRDVTISNSTWGNRLLNVFGPRDGVHAVGGGIGQGLPMAIGAALAANGRKTLCLSGDGGLQLCLGELATAAQETADMVLLVMNSGGYAVIKNIQDAHYGGRHHYVDLLTPNLGAIAAAMGIPHRCLTSLGDAPAAFGQALTGRGPSIIEIDMTAIGEFTEAFAGPPVREKAKEPAE